MSEVHHALAALVWLTEGAPDGRGCASERVARLFAESDMTVTSRSRAVASTSLSIASSWASILDDASGDTSRFTTSTGSRLTTALRTLNSCLSPVTSATTMPPCGCLRDGSSSTASDAANASSAEHTNTLGTLRRSVPESAIGPIAQSVAAVCAAIAADLSADREAGSSAPEPATTTSGLTAESGTRGLTADSRPIVLARKPGPLRELAIDRCRIGTGADKDDERWYEWQRGDSVIAESKGMNTPGRVAPRPSAPAGRWPANVILTADEDGRAIFDGGVAGVVGGGEAIVNARGPHRGPMGYRQSEGYDDPDGIRGYDSHGTYSRFFVLPKADRADREPVVHPFPATCPTCGTRDLSVCSDYWHIAFEDGLRTNRVNLHPTVKPTELMQHLVRLVTPPGGLVLDPFGGSGSTALACEREGLRWVLIEKEEEYVKIAEARLNGTQRGLGLAI